MSIHHARQRVDFFSQFEVVLIRPEMILEAIDLQSANQISFWDALIIRSAAIAGCHQLFTEDLNAGQTINGVLVENPFAL